MHICIIGQASCQDLIKSILPKFNIYGNSIQNLILKKGNDVQYWAAIRPMALWARLGPAAQAAWPAHAESAAWARSPHARRAA
jgi:hypothetical protein